jgi:hypothetical protein
VKKEPRNEDKNMYRKKGRKKKIGERMKKCRQE